MRNSTLCLLLLSATACFVTSADPTGKRCDDSHPCPTGLSCIAGECVAGCGEQTGQPCTAGRGECARTGVYQCANGQLACDAQPGTPSPEICDGKDNDCDGVTDNGLTAPACALTKGVCAGSVKRCGGTAGWLDCTASDYGADYEAAETRCDGKDNDCDGVTDNDLPDAPPCALTKGVCAGSVKRCNGSSGWLDCTAADYGADYETAETRCDGKDNDCDGMTDNDLPGAPPCALTKGVCAGSVKRCNGSSGWLDCTAADYGPDYETVETKCDGKDNDCDGSTDNALTAPACALTRGVCAGSVKRCGGTSGWLDCTASDYGADYEVAETRCDGKDNDCDGSTDNGLAAPACALTRGVCAGSVKRCGGSAGWLDCTASDYGADYEAAETRCDGKDNDCDGSTDNALTAPACALTKGVCAGSVKRCGGSAGWLDCTASDYGADYEAAETRCDGKDNDCDGSTDNGLAAPACALTKGVCAGSVKRCGGGSGWLDCTASDYGSSYQTKESACDGLDNDCDGYVDNTSGCVWTVTGIAPPGYADGSLMAQARFYNPEHLLALQSGDLLVSEDNAQLIRRISFASGQVTTEAGTAFVWGSANGPPGTGRLDGPMGMVERSDGTVAIADAWGLRIRSLKNGVLSTLAGNGSWGTTNGSAQSATFECPSDVLEINGKLYITDIYACQLRAFDGTNVSTAAGSSCGYRDASALNAQFDNVWGLAKDGSNNIYISESPGRIRVLWATGPSAGKVTTLAGGTGSGWVDNSGTLARFNEPRQLVASATGLYVADSGNNAIRFVTWAGGVSTVAGVDTWGIADGPTATASFDSPTGVALLNGVLYSTGETRVRKIDSGTVTTVAGGTPVPWADGPRGTAILFDPAGVTTDPATEIAYFTDMSNYVVRSLTTDGTVKTVAGTVGAIGYVNGTLRGAQFGWLNGLKVLPDGTLLVADGGNSALRVIDIPGNSVTTLAGNGSCGDSDGPVASAQLCEPTDLVLGPNGEIYFVQDSGLVRVLAGGQVTTINGAFHTWSCADDPNPTGAMLARFEDLEGITLGPDGLLYVADHSCCQIKSVDPSTGAVVTVAGSGSCDYSVDGPLTGSTQLNGPTNLAFVGSDLYFLEASTPALRKIDFGAATLTTVAGQWNAGFADGTGTNASFFQTWGLGVAPGGGFYIGDLSNNRIRRFQP